MKNVSVIGAGTMGSGIAQVFAQKKYLVTLIDNSETALSKAMLSITQNLDRMVAKGLLTELEKENALLNITICNALPKGVRKADLALEAATENEGLKYQIFRDLDAFCPPETILATNTSSISITKIAAITNRPEKVIGMHFMNPAPIMQLIEVILGYNTAPKTKTTIFALAELLGKTPTIVADYPGFVANRILMPMLNEAIESLYQGVAGVAEIDTVMKLGMGHPMGPLQLADFIGLDVCLSILEVMYSGFKNPKYAPCPLLVSMVNAGKLGLKTGEGFYFYGPDKKPAKISDRFTNEG